MADELPPTPSEPGNSAPPLPPPLPSSSPPPLPSASAATPTPQPVVLASSAAPATPTRGPSEAPARQGRRWVISSFIGTFLSTLAFVLLAAGAVNVIGEMVAGNAVFQNPNPQFLIPFVIVPAVIVLMLATAGTAFGWVGLAGIRRSKGQKRGLFLGLVGALMWPLLLLSIVGIFVPTALMAQAAVMRGEFVGPERFFAALSVAVVLSFLIAWVVGRWSANPKAAKALLASGERPRVRHKPFLMAFTTVAYVTANLVATMIFVRLQVEDRQTMEAQRFANQGQPMPMPVPPEIEPPPNAPVQQVRRLPAINGAVIEPGRSATSECNVLGMNRALTEMRITFWSNSVPVDLPSMKVRAELPLSEDTATSTAWQLDTEAGGSHLTLTGPRVGAGVDGVTSQTVKLEVPAEVRWMAMPAGTAVRATPAKTSRQWLYLSTSDAALGQRLNAEWAISVDVALVRTEAPPALTNPLPK